MNQRKLKERKIMRYKKFGKTGLEVSQICLGTWGIGGAGWDAYSDEERMDAIKAAVDILTAGKGQVIKVEKLQ